MRGTKIGYLGALLIAQSAEPTFGQSTDVYQYDAQGRITTVQTGVGARTVYHYDNASNRSTVNSIRQFDISWQAQSSSLGHVIGYADQGGWATDVNRSSGYMLFGPYTTGVTSGQRTATWRMMVDNNFADDAPIVEIDVNDFDSSQVLASAVVNRMAWKTSNNYEVFELPFNMDASRAGHRIEIRIYAYGNAYIRADRVGYY